MNMTANSTRTDLLGRRQQILSEIDQKQRELAQIDTQIQATEDAPQEMTVDCALDGAA